MSPDFRNEKKSRPRGLPLWRAKGQSILEYTVLLSIVTMALIVMTPLFRRAVQAMVKGVADQLGNQVNAIERETEDGGRFLSMDVSMEVRDEKDVKEYLHDVEYDYNQRRSTEKTSTSILGFRETE